MTWTTGQKPNVAEECSYCDSGKARFILSDDLFGVISKLCKDVVTEWQMLLTGEERENNEVYFNGYYIPEQSVSSASVKMNECMDLEEVQRRGIIATIHSHGSMKVFFSGTDYTDTNTSFIKNHMVVNNKNEFVGTKAIELPCGMKRFIDATISRDTPPIVMPDAVEGVDKISKIVIASYGKGYDDILGESHIQTKTTRKKHAWRFADDY